MLAIPVKDISGEVLSDLYGNAGFFAFCDKSVDVKVNDTQGSGIPTAKFIIDSGAKATLQTHMGKGLFEKLDSAGVEVYYVKEKDLKLADAMEKFENGEFPQVTKENADDLLDAGGAGTCQCGCENK